MTRIQTFIVSLAVVMSLFAVNVQADPPEGYPFVGFDQGMKKAKQSGKHVFLYFGRYGCGFCDKTNKESFIDPEVKRRYSEHYELVYVDAESGRRITLPSGERITEQQLGARLKTLITPYFLFMEPDGTVILKEPGFKTKKNLIVFDDFVHGGHYRKQTLAQFSQKGQ